MAATPIGFAELVLGLPLYPWQDRALAPLEVLTDRPLPSGPAQVLRKKITVSTPNGAGKSERIVAAAALYWVTVHKRGRVVITTKDGRQLAEQIYPALTRHRAKFPGWQWVTSPHIRITTPTGGTINAFTTDDPGRAEGWHMNFDPATANYDGPLLIIVDEAKSVPEAIFDALDRCGANVFMYTSSPGVRAGRFYESHTRLKEDFIVVQAGLKDCPHIPRAKIEDIIRTHGEDAPFTRSSVYGEFMDSTTRQVFDREGLARLREMSLMPQTSSRDGRIDPQLGGNGKGVFLVPTLSGDPSAWFRWWGLPFEGRRHVIVCDSASGAEQQAGSNNPDRHSVLVVGDTHEDAFGILHKPSVVGRIIPPCHAALDILADRLCWLSRWLGNALVVIEANNTGLALIELCKARGVPLFRRVEGSADNPIFKPGFLTNRVTRPFIIANLATDIREQSLDLWCPHIVSELASFVKLPDGTEAAEGGLHDDDVLALAIGRRCLPSGTVYRGQTKDRPRDGYRQRAGATS